MKFDGKEKNINEFSQMSYNTNTNSSYCSDNVSVSSLPGPRPIAGNPSQCLVSTMTTPSPNPSFRSRIDSSVPYRINGGFDSDFDEIECDNNDEEIKNMKEQFNINSHTSSALASDCIQWNKHSIISMNSSHNDVDKKVPSEPLKAFFSLAFLGVSWVANASSLALTHEYVPNYEPLPDIILDNIAYQSWALDVSEILLMISIIAAVVVVVFHKYRFILLRRIWFLLGLLYCYRSVTIFVTVLPKADSGYECSQKAGNITALLVVNRVVTILSGGGLSINGKHIYCGDYIFSGHTVIFVMAYLCIKQYTPSKYYPIQWLSLLMSVCGIIFLMLARGHYTIDILIAYALTYWLWISYHTIANIPMLKSKHKDNQMKGLLWWHILRWFEANTNGSIPNEFSIPFLGLMKKLWSRCQSPPLTSCNC